MRSFPSFVHCAKPHPLPRRTANVLLGVMSPSTKNKRKRVVELVGEELVKELKPFQVKGIEYGLGRNGRVLIGDEMGLGKTLQALAIASYYSDEWPLLVVSPSSIRFQWRDQSIRWLPHLVQESRVCIVKNGRSKVPEDAQIVIISYELLAKNVNFQRVYKVDPTVVSGNVCTTAYCSGHYLRRVPLFEKWRSQAHSSDMPHVEESQESYFVVWYSSSQQACRVVPSTVCTTARLLCIV
eukprot:GHVS01025775.1.p2 GENE.GHVS01025775.1~~GHVS01025775.1.p2  ORF type:complete len:239 (+),score=23.20 GHVS01025775.1:960-1676(+)